MLEIHGIAWPCCGVSGLPHVINQWFCGSPIAQDRGLISIPKIGLIQYPVSDSKRYEFVHIQEVNAKISFRFVLTAGNLDYSMYSVGF